MGRGVTTDTQLTRVGRKILGESYIGTFSSDVELKNVSKAKPLYAIINVDGRYEAGSHWLAIAKPANTENYLIYDSFARKSRKLIPKFIRNHNYKYIDLNKVSDQNDEEQDCGARAMSLLVYIAKYGKSFANKI